MRSIRCQRVAGPAQRGLTIVELMVTLVITGVLLAVAVPSMREFIARQRVVGTAQELATDLRYLRASQAQRSEPIRVDFGSTADFTCYTVYTLGSRRGTCNCTRVNTPRCDDVLGPPIELKTVVLPRDNGVVLTSNPVRLTIDLNGLPVGGTTLAVSVSGVSLGGEVRVSTNAVATPALCSASGHGGSLPACP